MKARAFNLELDGPPGSGKSTFIQFIMEACQQSKEWAAVRGEAHALTIINVKNPILEPEPGGSHASNRRNSSY